MAAETDQKESRADEMIVVVGAGGEEAYGLQFREWGLAWEKLANESGIQVQVIGLEAMTKGSDRESLQVALEKVSRKSPGPLWLILIGHGTFDNRISKFNLTGPDITPEDLAEWLAPMERKVILINTFSASGPFIPGLSAPGRIIVTATRSGQEENFSHLGGYLVSAWKDKEADRDQDGQISLLEAWLHASSKTADFYSEQGRLLTEHTLLDDNGDGLGTPAEWYRGLRAEKKPEKGKGLDGMEAHQAVLILSEREIQLGPELRAQRDALEHELESLRETKSQMDIQTYYTSLEEILLNLARIYRQSKDNEDKPTGENE